MMAARVQFATLLYSFKHPKYQKLHLRDLLEPVKIPELLKSYLESHKSFSVSIRALTLFKKRVTN